MKNWSKYFYGLGIALLLSFEVCHAQIIGIKIAGDTCTDISLSLQAEGTSGSPYFFWNFGDPLSGTKDTATFTGLSSPPFPTHTFSGPGVYKVCVSFQEPGEPVSTICRKISVQFCCQGSIVSTDTCFGKNIGFDILSDKTVLAVNWDFGDVASGTNNTATGKTPTHRFSSIGNYTVRAIVNFDCGIDTLFLVVRSLSCNAIIVLPEPIDSKCKLVLPNAFTPNNDFINDEFGGKFNCPFDQFEITIANRWGQIIFTTKDQNQKWDGLINGQKAETGIYFYIVKYRFPNQNEKRISGDVFLVR